MKKLIKLITMCSSVTILMSCTGNNSTISNTNHITQNILQNSSAVPLHSNVKDADNLSWHIIGSPRFSTGGTDNEKTVVDPDGNIYVAYADYAQQNKLVVMTYSAQKLTWSKLGTNSISLADASSISMVAAPNGNLYLAFTDAGRGNKAAVMTYDKASNIWKTVGGDAVSTGKSTFNNIIVDANSNPFLAYSDLENSSKTKVMTYDKSSFSWKDVGTFATNAKSEFNSMAVAPDGTLYLVCSMYDFNMGRALVKSYDKSSQQWNMVGDIALSNGIAQYTSIAISPNGIPYITFADQGNDGKAKVMAYDKSVNHWRVVGNAGISVGSSQYNNIATAPDGKVEIVFKDAGSSNKATALYFDNISQSWKPLSSNSALISEGEANHISLTLNKDGLPYVAYSDNFTNTKQITVAGYTLPSWHYVGKPGFSGADVQYTKLKIASDGTLYTAFRDYAHNFKISVMSYNKNNNQWQYVGNAGFSMGDASEESLQIAPDGSLYVGFIDSGNGDKVSVMTYNKNNNLWQYVGPASISNSATDDPSLIVGPNGSLYLAFAENNFNYRASLMAYNKTNNQWYYLTNNPTITSRTGYATNLAISADGTILYIAFSDGDYDSKASVMSYNLNSRQLQYVGNPGCSDGDAFFYVNIQVGADGTLYLSFRDEFNDKKASVMTYNKSTNQWQHLGPHGVTQYSAETPNLFAAPDNNIYLAFGEEGASVMTYNRSKGQWQYVGDPIFSPWIAHDENLAMDPDGRLYVAFSDWGNKGVTVMSYY